MVFRTKVVKQIFSLVFRSLPLAMTIMVSVSFLSALAAPTAPGNVTVSGDSTRPTVSWNPSTADPNGVNWTQVRKNSQVFAPWSARSEFPSVVFNNKVWVLGGSSGGNVYNDVWSSSDGINWTQETASAAWAGRSGHTAVVFNNKIWVIGGEKGFVDNYAVLGDVWSSSDGVNWTQETASPAWGTRVLHSSVVFNNKMWVIGGYVDHDRRNDIWSSSDGVNWTQETAHAAFPGRIRSSATVLNNKVWVLGGDLGSTVTNDVWSSSDGVNWTQATAGAAWGERNGHRAEAFNGKLWVMGGSDFTSYDSKSDVWSSSDGVNWTQAAARAWPARDIFASAVFNSQLVVMGGHGGGNDVWSSSDGANWTGPGTSSGAAWLMRGGMPALSFNNKMWVLGGNDDNFIPYQDVWSSSDGASWTQETAAAPWPARYAHAAVVFNNKMWVMGGGTGSASLHDVWSSSDGVNWTQATASAAWSARQRPKVVSFNGKMWLMGGLAGSTKLSDVWSSSDGITWTLANANAWPGRYGHQALVYNNKMWVMGGNSTSSALNDVWSSSDGTSWTQETASAGWSVRNAHEAQVFDGKMWVLGGRDSNFNSINNVWSSTDGVNWTEATSGAGWPGRRSFASVVLNNNLWVLGGEGNNSKLNDVWSTSNNSIDHYKVCWDTVQDGCTYSANVAPDGSVVASASSKSLLEKLGLVGIAHAAGNQISFTLTNPLSPGTWYFSVAAVTGGGTLSTQSLLSTYSVKPPGAPNTGAFGPVRNFAWPGLVVVAVLGVGYLLRRRVSCLGGRIA